MPVSAQAVEAPDSVTTLTGTIRGRFQDGTRPLAYAIVEVSSGAVRVQAVADSLGRYRLAGVARGRVRLRATHAGYAALTLMLRIPPAGEMSVDLELEAEPVRLSGVAVRTEAGASRPTEEEEAADVGTATIPDPGFELRMLEISPSIGEAGVAAAVQALPGNDPADPSDVLFMRGSTTELKLVLLDGVPVFTPFHVAGLMRSFEPSVLGSADLHVGGAPARYDGGLTHILDLRTRSPRRDRVRASASLDLISASAAAETPLGSHAGAIVSARSLHDLGQTPLGGERPYGYRDLLMSVEADVSPKHGLRATGFWNEESVRLDFSPRTARAAWSNAAAAVTYRGSIGEAALRVTAGASRYDADLPLQPTPRGDDPEPEALLASASSDRARLVAELAWGSADAPVRAGVSLEDLSAAFMAESFSGDARTGGGGTSSVVGGFIDLTRPLGPGVSVRAGLRGDLYSDDRVRLSPRATVYWALRPDALVSVAAGRYHQVTRTPDAELDETLSAFANQLAAPDELLPVATADHVVLSLDQRLASSVSLGISGFWKRFDGLGGTGEEGVLNSGIDLRVLRAHEGGAVWLGYGLTWFWSRVDLAGNANDFVGRHLLSAGTSGGLGGPFRGEARLSYGAGLPSTSIPFGASEALSASAPDDGAETQAAVSDPLGASLAESFLRVDLEIHAVFEPVIGGRKWRLRPYLRLLNALDRRDALFYTYQPWRSSEITPLAQRPILPLLGFSFSF